MTIKLQLTIVDGAKSSNTMCAYFEQQISIEQNSRLTKESFQIARGYSIMRKALHGRSYEHPEKLLEITS